MSDTTGPSIPRDVPRRALVTGGGRGIGRSIAHALVADGFTVIVSARSAQELAETATTAPDPARVHALPADLTDEQACEDLAVAAAQDGPITALVHNAGISDPAWLPSVTNAGWHRHFAVNVTAPMILSRALIPAMVDCGWGRIVSLGTLYSRYGIAGTAAYAASKHAILGLTRVLAAEYAQTGITANTVAPGYVDTDMVREHVDRAARGRDRDETLRRVLRTQPIGRLIQPEEVAGLVSYLCSDASAAITGQAINIDGGTWQG